MRMILDLSVGLIPTPWKLSYENQSSFTLWFEHYSAFFTSDLCHDLALRVLIWWVTMVGVYFIYSKAMSLFYVITGCQGSRSDAISQSLVVFYALMKRLVMYDVDMFILLWWKKSNLYNSLSNRSVQSTRIMYWEKT